VFCLERRGPEWIEQDDSKCGEGGGAGVRPADQQDCIAADDCSWVWLTGPYSQVLGTLMALLSFACRCFHNLTLPVTIFIMLELRKLAINYFVNIKMEVLFSTNRVECRKTGVLGDKIVII